MNLGASKKLKEQKEYNQGYSKDSVANSWVHWKIVNGADNEANNESCGKQ